MSEVGPTNETPVNKEYAPQTPYDALQIIEYEVKGKGEHRRPDTRGLMQLDAAVDLLAQGITKNVVIAGVHYKTENETDSRISELYGAELQKRLKEKGISGINIFAESALLSSRDIEKGSKDTGGDVEFLLKQAKGHDWKKILVLGYEQHLERIALLLQRRGVKVVEIEKIDGKDNTLTVATTGAQNVLQRRHTHFRARFEASPFRLKEGASFSNAEKNKLRLMVFFRQGKALSFLAHHMPQVLKQKVQS
ncbi:MAG: hypothetical protein M1426_04855 [Patescibacteria group bacterium]|nr:hypothetical protein [Patescibacteria group bacterium]